eukprot:1940170-Alexandrium_andersonii.AAC.1
MQLRLHTKTSQTRCRVPAPFDKQDFTMMVIKNLLAQVFLLTSKGAQTNCFMPFLRENLVPSP